MGISISSALATASLAAGNAAPGAAAQRIQPATNNSADTVTLTEAERVYQLYNQGAESQPDCV